MYRNFFGAVALCVKKLSHLHRCCSIPHTGVFFLFIKYSEVLQRSMNKLKDD